MPSDMPPLPGDEPPEGEEIREPEQPPEETPAEAPTEEEEPAAEPEQPEEEPGAEPELPAGDPSDEDEDEDEGESGPGSTGGSTEDDEDEAGEGAGDGMAGGDASGDTSESDDGDDGDEGSEGATPTSGSEVSVPGGTPEEGGGESAGTVSEGDPERDLFKEIAEAPVKDFDEAASDALSKEAREATRNASYSVFTRDEDSLAPLEVPAEFDQAQVNEMQKQVDHMIGPLQKDLQRAIAARSAAVYTGGHRSGKLHGASLARVLTGRDDVFRQKQVSRTKDVAVELVVDASGSMWRKGKIVIAAYAAYALSAVLDNIGIANEVVAFSTKDFTSGTSRAMNREAVEHGLKYSRTAALDIRILKAFNERMTPATRRRFAMLSTGGEMMEENVDGESVQLANHRLQQQRAARKVMMVLSDGMPACGGGLSPILNEHLKAVVKQIESRGTDVVALGILDESVKKFYKRAIVLNSVEDLPRIVMHELHKLLVH
jgi:cobalamin biosynthesis protein CobT